MLRAVRAAHQPEGTTTMSAFSRRLHPGVLLAVVFTFVLAGLAPIGNAAAPPPTATAITITRISTPAYPTAAGAPWSDTVTPFVVAGQQFTTDIAFYNGASPAPLSWTKDVTITLTETAGPNPGLVLNTFKVPAGSTSVSIPGSIIASAHNFVTVEAKAGKGPTAIITTKTFEVLQEATAANNGTTTKISVGGTGSGVGTSCTPTAEEPWCSELILPSPDAVLDNRIVIAQGECDGVCENTLLSYTVGIFQVNPTVVDDAHPVTAIVKCDKTQCPGDPKSFLLGVRLTPEDEWDLTVEPCAKSGQLNPGSPYCFDAQASNRDGAGDLIQVVLFRYDMSIARKP